MSKKGKEALLLWCKRATEGYKGVDVQNFTTSWTDGLAFCAIIHSYRNDLIPWDQLKSENKEENLKLAFSTAEKLGIPPLLDVEDMLLPTPEPFSIITYLSQYYHFFNNKPKGGLANIEFDEKKRKIDEGDTQPKHISHPSKIIPIDCCVKCGQELEGAVIEVMNKMYHQSCFGCHGCGKKLTNKCLNVDNNPYCEICGKKAFINSRPKNKNQSIKTDFSNTELKVDNNIQNNKRKENIQNNMEDKSKEIKKNSENQENNEIKENLNDIKESKETNNEIENREQKEDDSVNNKKPLPTIPPKPNKLDQEDGDLFIPPNKPLPNPKNLRESEESEIISAKKPLPIPQKPPLTLFNQSSQSQLINKEIKPPAKPKLPPNLTLNEKDAGEMDPTIQKGLPLLPKKKPLPIPEKTEKQQDQQSLKQAPPLPKKPENLRSEKSPPPLPVKPKRQQSTRIVSSFDDMNLSSKLAQPEEVNIRVSYRRSLAVNIPDKVSANDLPNLEGFLEKKGDVGMIKSWKRRYFRLKGDRLIYYADKESKEKDNPIGYILLKTAVRFKLTPSEKRPGDFLIITVEPERTWLLRAETEEEANKWINACIIHSKYVAHPKETNENNDNYFVQKKEGFLDKLHGGVTGKIASLRKQPEWRPRWFVLKDGILFKYESKNDPKPSKLPLYKCKLEEFNELDIYNQEVINTQFQITTKQKTLTLRAHSEEEMHEWLNMILKHKLMIEQIIDGIEI